MRRLRHFSLLFLVLYAAFAVGIYLHSHPADNSFHNDCQLCQASAVTLIQAAPVHCAPQMTEIGMLFQAALNPLPEESRADSFGRAPPLAS